ncbi:MAG: tetratricopeptide repeat protein [Planctomycetota bacterium]
MAKKRVNKSILTAVVVGFIVIVGGGAVAYWATQSVDVGEAMAAGDAAYEAGDYEEALIQYRRITSKIKDDPEIIVKVADTRNQMAGRDRDPEDFAAARGFYRNALEVDPGYLPAHYRVVDTLTTMVEYGIRQDGILGNPRERATDLLALEPDNVAAKKLFVLSTVREYIGSPEDISPDDLDQARLYMQELIAADYALDGMSVQWLSQLAAFDASRDRSVLPNAPTEAVEEINRLVSGLEEVAGDDAMRWYHASTAAMSAMQIAGIDQQVDVVDTWRERQRAAITKAAELAAEAADGEQLMTIAPTFSRFMAGEGDEKSEALFRQLREVRPWDERPRQLLAEFLNDRQRSDEAVEVLEGELPEGPVLPGQDGLAVRNHQAQTIRLRALYRLEALKRVEPENADERATRLAEIQPLIDAYEERWRRLTDVPVDSSPDLLQLNGMYQIAQGDYARGIATLKRADTLVRPADRLRKLRLWYELAQANLALRQTGPARQYLEQILQFNPGFAPARLSLARMHISERRFDAAQEQVEALLEADPDNESYQQLAVLALGDEARGQYDALPEQTASQIARKRQAAIQLNMLDEAGRLLAKLVEVQPNNPSVASAHAIGLVRAGKTDEAIAVLERSLEDPVEGIDKSRAEALLKRLKAGSIEEYVDANATEYQKKLYEYQVARLRGDMEGADLALEEAERLQPEDNDRATRLKFRRLLEKGEFDAAEPYLQRLAASANDGLDGASYRIEWLMAQSTSRAIEATERQAVVDQALSESRALVRDLPESANAALVLAKLLEQVGDNAGALTAYERVRELQPSNSEALDGLIRINLRGQNERQARFYIDEARALFPRDETFQERELLWEMAFGDPKIAVDARRRVYNNDPDDVENQLQLALALRQQGERAILDDVRNSERVARESFTEAASLLEGIITNAPETRQILRVIQLAVDTHRANKDLQGGLAAIEKASAVADLKDSPFLVGLQAQFLFEVGDENNNGKPRAVEFLAREIDRFESEAGEVRADMRRRLSDYLTQMGEHDRAIAVLNVEDTALQEVRLEKMANLGRLDEAAAAVEILLQTKPNDVEVLTLAAFTELKRRDFETAKQYIDRAVDVTNGGNAAVKFVRGIWYMSVPEGQRDYAAAVADLSDVRDVRPGNIQARSYLANAMHNTGAHGDAINELISALQVAPTNVPLRLQLAGLYRTGNIKNAEFDTRRPDLAANVLADGRNEPGLENNVVLLREEARLRSLLGENRLAEELFKRAVAASNNNPQIVLGYLELLLGNGKPRLVLTESTELANGDTAQTWWIRPVRAEALVAEGRSSEARRELAMTFGAVADSNFAAARAITEAAAKIIGPDYAVELIGDRTEVAPRWRVLSAVYKFRAGNAEQAIAEARSALEEMDAVDPMRWLAISSLGSALLEVDPARPDEARPYLEQLVERDANDFSALNNLAYCLTLIGGDDNIDRAVELSGRAVELIDRVMATGNTPIAPRNLAFVYDTHGWALVQDGQLEAGIPMLLKAVNTNEFVQGYYHLAEAYRRNGEMELMREVAGLGAKLLNQPLQQGENVTDEVRAQLIQWANNQVPTN